MHASIDQLLKLREDESADEAAARHVSQCARCLAQLEGLRAVTRGLRSLPDRWTPPDRLAAIREELARPARPVTKPRARPGWLLPAATAAAVVVAVVVTLSRESAQQAPGGDSAPPAATMAASGEPSSPNAAAGTNAPSVEDAGTVPEERLALIDESRRLQEVLDTLPTRPSIVRASTAMTVADLEDRIEWVDYRLTNRNMAGLDAQDSERLWRERVELLNSLVAVRYAEARATSF
jgi:hypothetical protein